MSEQYLIILLESLKKKDSVLGEILRISQRQNVILSSVPVDFEEFDRCVDDKDICIEQIVKLDAGFETLYQNVGIELREQKHKYASEIKELQKWIQAVTEKSVSIEALEKRNKALVEETLQKRRREMGDGKRSVKAAMTYYRNMNYTNVVSPQYMDKKK